MSSIQPILENTTKASIAIKLLADDQKKAVLIAIADKVRAQTGLIITENKKDLDKMADSDPKKDRLLLNETRMEALAKSLEEIAELPDPANRILSEKTLPNGLLVQKLTVPLGVVGVIYESRPNVTLDVAALCIRSGNACILRGGSDAFYTNIILVQIIQAALQQFNLDIHIVQLLPVDRKHVAELLSAKKYVDIIIPRGSQQLIEFVRKNSLVPVIETGAGVCHTYVEKTANLENAAQVVTNAKVSRPSVCNALDTVLVDQVIAADFLNLLAPQLAAYQVEVFADELSFPIFKSLDYPYLQQAQPDDFGREFLDLKCSVKVVSNMDEALEHIRVFSSKHSEAILSEDAGTFERFLNEVDAAAVYANASTRFTDGGVFGLGAEIGISTQKLHARGPFALEKLVTEKWVVRGQGQIR